MKHAALLLMLAAGALAAIDGTVVNRTTGKPQPGATITLFKIAQGMEPLETVKSDSSGSFRIAKDAQGPRLIQTEFDGVNYNQMLPPGAATSGLTLDVFNASRSADEAKVTQHYLIFQPSESQMSVNEGFIFQNTGKLTYNDPAAGTLKFYLPAAAQGKVTVQATAPQGMPIERSASRAAQTGVYKVDFPIKPGETRFDITYQVPYTAPATFAGKVLYPGTVTSLVAPQGVEIKGDGLALRGQEPRSHANVYEVKTASFQVSISGALAASSEGDSGSSGENSIQEVLPRANEHLLWLVALAFAILGLGFTLLYRARLVDDERRRR